MIRAVLFDLDDTLFDHRGCSRDALAAVRACHGAFQTIAEADLERTHARVLEDLHAEVMLGRLPLEQARRERFRRLLGEHGVRAGAAADAAAEAGAAAYRDRYREVRRAVRGAAALLERLRARAAVGILSNNLYEEQLDKLRVCGLAPLVDVVVVSEREGVSKPDPAIFLTAMARLGGTPGTTVMVGDSWAADVAGAQAAGLSAIWFNPQRLPRPAGAAPVREIHALEPADRIAEAILAQPASTWSS